MPGRNVHQVGGAVTGIATIAVAGEATIPNLLLGGVLGHYAGRLPDMLEPATSPHHRQFFHSWSTFIALGFGLKSVYDWEPDTDRGKLLRNLSLVVGAGYLSHLVLDSLTKKSLPLV